MTGIRRSGKSTILQEFKEYLLKNGVDESDIIYINLDDQNYRNLLDVNELHDYILSNVNLEKKTIYF